jgi:hypothetical protein
VERARSGTDFCGGWLAGPVAIKRVRRIAELCVETPVALVILVPRHVLAPRGFGAQREALALGVGTLVQKARMATHARRLIAAESAVVPRQQPLACDGAQRVRWRWRWG